MRPEIIGHPPLLIRVYFDLYSWILKTRRFRVAFLYFDKWSLNRLASTGWSRGEHMCKIKTRELCRPCSALHLALDICKNNPVIFTVTVTLRNHCACRGWLAFLSAENENRQLEDLRPVDFGPLPERLLLSVRTKSINDNFVNWKLRPLLFL